jgi:aryl-alcohol dehydrogenase-like predicted oxidoreductase
MAREMGLGVVPWSPLAGGVLTGKYSRADLTAPSAASGDGTRKSVTIAGGTLTERNLAIVDVVKDVATELARTPAQVALAWTLQNPAVTSPIIGARTPAQLNDNLGALDVPFTPAQLTRLNNASAFPLGFPHETLARPSTLTLTRGDLTLEPRT